MRICHPVIIVLFILPGILFAQAQSDSLEIRLRNATGVTRTKILVDLAYTKLFKSAQYKESLDLLMKAEENARETGDSASMGEISKYLGFNCRFLSRYKKAIEYLDEAIAIFTATGDTGQLISALNEKANVYYFTGEMARSTEIRLQALKFAMMSGNLHAQSYITHDLGFDCMNAGDYRKATNYFLLNLLFSNQAGDGREISIAASNAAHAYLMMNMTDSAMHYLLIADSVAGNSGQVYELSLVYRQYSELYAHKKDYRNAFLYLQKFHALSDTIFNLAKEIQINEMTMKFESDKREHENRMFRQQYRNALTIFLIIAGFVVFTIGLLLWMNRKKKIINKELEKRNNLIQQQKNELSEALEIVRNHEQELAEANTAKNVFFTIIAHDLKNPFTALLGFSDLLANEHSSFTQEEQRKMSAAIAESAGGLYKLLENLLEWTRTQTDRIEVKTESFDINEVIVKNMELFKTAASQKNVSLVFERSHPVMVSADSGMVDFILRNLLSNALKYVHRDGTIRFTLDLGDKLCSVSVADNGVGIPEENLAKLFRIDGKVKTNGTANEKGTGLGLIICREFILKNKGTISAISKPGSGSTFTITIPLTCETKTSVPYSHMASPLSYF
jgi:signal transduction histidine kinase